MRKVGEAMFMLAPLSLNEGELNMLVHRLVGRSKVVYRQTQRDKFLPLPPLEANGSNSTVIRLKNLHTLVAHCLDNHSSAVLTPALELIKSSFDQLIEEATSSEDLTIKTSGAPTAITSSTPHVLKVSWLLLAVLRVLTNASMFSLPPVFR